METGACWPQPTNGEAQLVVGGRKFTTEEFLNAITQAVIETVRSYSSGKAGKPDSGPSPAGDSAENLEPSDEGCFENAIEVAAKAFE
jgi:hypothetical protein